jgi:hypothetical protein
MGLDGRRSDGEGMGRIARLALIACGGLLALAVFLPTGCGRENSPVERQERGEGIEEATPKQGASPPTYEIRLENDFEDEGLTVKRYDVSTGATSGEDFEAITAELRDKSSGYQVVQVVFYPENSAADVTSGAGFAFKNEEIARTVLSEGSVDDATVEDRVREAMANGGIYVVSMADQVGDAPGG